MAPRNYNLFYMLADEYDVVVVGSGAAGMTAALASARSGLSVVLIEKAGHFGGSTARSGGGVWIPNNRVLQHDGVSDTAAEASRYLHSIVGDVVPAERIDTYLDRGPEALAFLLDNSPLRMQWVPDYSDYYPEAPGGRVGGRSIEPKPFDLNRLGAERANLEPDYGKSPLNVTVTQADFRWATLLMRHPRGVLRVLRIGARWLWSMATRKDLVVRGQAFAAALRLGLVHADVPVALDTALDDLVVDDDRVAGVVVTHEGITRTIRARHGVVLGCGGFEHNEAMRKQYQREPIGPDWSVGAAANTGDGILAGERAGAALDLMDDAWWGPTIPLTGGPWFCLAERTLPGGIMVNARGERFMNEALPYVEATHRMYGGDEYGRGDGPGENIPCWMVIDQRYRNRYVFAGVQPRRPFPGRWYKAGVIQRADTIAELATKIGIDPGVLERTITTFNGFARTGRDEQFGRGDSGYDRYYGDPTIKPNPCLSPIDQAPYYAVTMVPGDLGTKGGLRTDADARVLRADGSVIDGLYAAGNVSATVMGHTYAGPGATIGPAITFGYLAVQDIVAAGPNRSGGSRPCQLTRRSHSVRTCPPSISRGPASDVLLYHLALGAGQSPNDPRELRYTTEDDLRVLPTFAVVAPSVHDTEPPRVDYPGVSIDLAKVLHGSQRVEVHRRLPTDGTGRALARVKDIWDKGSAAVIVSETVVTDADGAPLWTNTSSIFARGEGGFGGARGPSGSSAVPDREPDAVIVTPTVPQQACGTGCWATATRCTPTRPSPSGPGSPSRSCTACALTAWSPRPWSTICWTATSPGCARSRRASPASCFPARRCAPARGAPTSVHGHDHRRRARRCARAGGRGIGDHVSVTPRTCASRSRHGRTRPT